MTALPGSTTPPNCYYGDNDRTVVITAAIISSVRDSAASANDGDGGDQGGGDGDRGPRPKSE